MTSEQEKDYENRDIDRKQGNRITAIHSALEINKHDAGGFTVQDVLDDAKLLLQFIESNS